MILCINYKIEKLFEINWLIAINFWWLIDLKNFNQYQP